MANNTLGNVTLSYLKGMQYIDMPVIRKELMNVNPEADFASLFYMAGAIQPVKDPVYKTRYSYANYNSIPLTGTTITPSGNATTGFIATITNVPQAVFETIQTQRTLYVNSSNQRVIVKSKSSPGGVNTVVVQNVKHTTGAAVSMQTTDVLVDFGSAMPIASGMVTGRKPDVYYLENQIQIIRSGLQWDDITSGSTNQGYMLQGPNNENIVLEWAWILCQRRHRADLSKTMLLGQKSDQKFQDTTSVLNATSGQGNLENVQTTHGFDAYVDDYGMKHTVATAGQLSGADFKLMLDRWDAAMMPKDLNVFGSGSVFRPFEDYVKNLAGTGVPSARLEMGGKSVDFTVEQVKRGGYTLNLSPQSAFSSTGQVSQRLAKSAFVVPSGVAPTYDIAGGGSVPYMLLRGFNPKKGGAQTEDQYTYLSYNGALADNPQGHTMDASVNMTSYVGFEMTAPQFTARIDGLA